MHESVAGKYSWWRRTCTSWRRPSQTRACNMSSDLIHTSHHIHTTHITYTIIYILLYYCTSCNAYIISYTNMYMHTHHIASYIQSYIYTIIYTIIHIYNLSYVFVWLSHPSTPPLHMMTCLRKSHNTYVLVKCCCCWWW